MHGPSEGEPFAIDMAEGLLHLTEEALLIPGVRATWSGARQGSGAIFQR